MIANRDIQRRMAAFARAEATRPQSNQPAPSVAIDRSRFYAAMARRVPVRPDRPGAVDPVAASRTGSEPFLLRG
jgi:hypothetical protein